MHDIKWIREAPEAFDAAMQRRGLGGENHASSAHILGLDKARRDALNELQELQQQRNAAAKAIGVAKKNGDDAAEAMANAQAIKEKIEQLETASANDDALEHALSVLPNRLDDAVPEGADEADNQQLRTYGDVPSFNFAVKDHVALGEDLGWLDFEQAAKVSGARFTYLKGPLARLERALANFMMDMHVTEYGYEEIVPPTLVRDDAVFGTGQLPKFKEDLFQTTDGRWLIPTAEVVLANLVRESIIDTDALPLRFTAYTPCYRSEAGSAGRDTRGMIRQHQFSKVELVSITTPEQSAAEHERMTEMAEEVLKRLGLPFRTMLLCSGDTGFSAHKTYDIEVWLPSQDCYREISSISNCGDFQARRMKARFRGKSEKQTQFPHMLNGSALAVGRCLLAIMENYQQADGSISIPERLVPYMGGMTSINARD